MDAPDTAAVVGTATTFDAVVLAGGRGTRMGGTDKAALALDGRTLLTHCLLALDGARDVVVVGDRTSGSLPRPVRFVREEPPWGGPAAALLVGLGALSPPAPPAGEPATVVVLAVDMPRVDVATVERLRAATTPAYDGAVLVDATGRRQLAYALDRHALSRQVPDGGDHTGLPLRRLLSGLHLADVAGTGDEARDVDTWDDLRGLSRR